jgi:hypothetical protein
MSLVGCGGTSTGSAALSPAQAVAADKAALAIGYASGDTSSNVTKNLTLPTSGTDGSTISWASSNSAVVTAAGVVSQPLTTDASVTLTATITVGTTGDTKTFPLTVKAQMTDAQAVAAAKAALAIGYASGDSASSVTKNVTLTATGLDGSAISWASSDPAVVTTAGIVSQPLTTDASVTLTATITVGTTSDTKTFPLTVKAQMTDAQAVAAAKAALAIGYAPGDAATSVTQNLTLAVTGLDGCTVSWTSSDPAISADGTVSQPVTGDVPVTLTATITHGAATDTRNLIVIVKAQMTDAQAVAAAKAALLTVYAEGDLPATVTQSLTLPLTGSSGCTVSWASSDPAVISPDGTVTRPLYGDAQVTLTATITSHEASDTADFPVAVKGQMSDADAVAAAKAALNIAYAPDDSAASVTQNVTLPANGIDGCSIIWASDTPATVATNGVVTQPPNDEVIVTLTATIRSHEVTDAKVFSLTV